MTDTTGKRGKKLGRLVLFVVMIVVGGGLGALVYLRRDRDIAAPDGGPGKDDRRPVVILAPEECRRAIQLKDISIGHLENGPSQIEVDGKPVCVIALAGSGFEQLTRQIADEALPWRNLAIARLLSLQNAQEGGAEARAAAQSAAQQLIEFDDQSPVAHWIAAMVELHPDAGNPLGVSEEARERAVALLEKSTALDPDDAVYWYALYRAATRPRDSEPSVRAREALGKAYAANPRNIYLITEWLQMQSRFQDPALAQTLTEARTVLAPLAAAVKRRGIDIAQVLDQAIQAGEAGDWKMVDSRIRMVGNVVRPEEIAKSDITRVDIHPLEFVIHDFSPEFYDRHEVPVPAFDRESSVRLVAASEPLLSALTDVRDLRVMDFTLNGIPDLLILRRGIMELWTRAEANGPWELTAALDVPEGMQGILAADLDRDSRKTISAPAAGGSTSAGDAANVQFDRVLSETATCHDADPDVIVYGAEGVWVVRNDLEKPGDEPKWVVVPNEGLSQLTNVTACLLVDVEQDADLDLIVASDQGVTIWEAGAKLTYTDISQWSSLPPAEIAVTAMVAVDWDRDVDIDIVLADASGRSVGILENLRHAEFRWVPFDDQFEQLRGPSSLALLEADGNVSWDLLAAGPRGVHLFLTSTPRSGIVQFLRAVPILDQPQTGVLACDLDNDGYRDAVTWGSDGLHVFRGGPGGTFEAAAILEGAPSGPILAVRGFDLRRDGYQDLIVATPDGVSILANQGGTDNHWLTLYPMGQEDNKGRCNHHALGSLVELRAGGWYQAQVVESPAVHFGLGKHPVAEQLRVVWTNGVPQDIVELAGNVAICERMALKGSCPYIYTMADGEFSFFSDCLWAAPLGLQTADGGVAPTRSWEYLRIGGDRLTPHEGSYWLKLTEELWEAGYFDFVQLIAVDHPADVEVHTNEKVGPPDIAQFTIHTVSQRRLPATAIDSQARDVSSQLREQDGEFVKAFDQRIRQGLAPEHYIELDLGPLDNPRQIKLFLTGWIFPTDTSLNVAFLQDPETDGPRMPSVWVPDHDGSWKETIPYMGFPGGKTKTIVVDLSDAFLTEDYRVRIQTTAEIYWDEVYFTVDEPEVPVRQIPLTLQSADLAYQGFSQPIPQLENAPQMYDYRQLRQTPQWPPMRGNFTRYGCVRELLLAGDDMMAVLGAGDAITVRFEVPAENPPDGWTRTFILHSIGWDKDADLNTIYGQTVEPLPFRAMKSYPFGPDEDVPDSPAYHEYLRRYQTRQQNPSAFWRLLKPVATP